MWDLIQKFRQIFWVGMVIMIGTNLLAGCSVEKTNRTKIRDLDYHVTAEEEIPEEVKQQNREKISEITKRMKDLRHDIKLAEDIKKRSPVMEERLEVIERENEKRRER